MKERLLKPSGPITDNWTEHAMNVNRTNFRPLNYREIRKQRKYKDLERTWKNLLRNNDTAGVVDGFLAEVEPLLNSIHLDKPVSNLLSKNPDSSPDNEESIPTLLNWVDLILAGQVDKWACQRVEHIQVVPVTAEPMPDFS